MKRFLSMLSLATVLGGCAAPLTQTEKGALGGGALGAGAGAIIGSSIHHGSPGKGALIGGALGALGGGLVGNQMEGQTQRQNAQSYEVEQQQREIERQRRELEQLRRDRNYSDEGSYNSGSYNRSYDRGYDNNPY